jgi:hypothetical protein
MSSNTLPSNFRSLIAEFTSDLTTTFPEYSYVWSKWGDEETTDEDLQTLYAYCMKVYPERFFDILYKNYDIFKPDSGIDVYFLPNASFRMLFGEEGLSENSKDVMWNYLQLILFTVVGDVKDKTSFGDAMNMFQGIEPSVIHDKMKEVMENIGAAFESMPTENQASDESAAEHDANADTEMPNIKEEFKNMFDKLPKLGEFAKKFPFSKLAGLPDISKLQEHLQTLFDGKIGKLAQELAQEVSGDFKDLLGNTENITNPQEVIKELMKDPTRISKLMKTVSSRLDDKMKSGEISREEIMKEASEMMNKMQSEGGENFAEMFKNMAKGMGKNMRLDTNAIDRMTKMSATKDRVRQSAMRSKQRAADAQAEQLRQYKERLAEQEALKAKYSLDSTGDGNNYVFKLEGEDKQEKSFIHPDLINEMKELEEKGKLNEQTRGNKKAGKAKKSKKK